ncbi:MAG: ISKra4 family transposase, partial [Acidimicrobiales bacterium]
MSEPEITRDGFGSSREYFEETVALMEGEGAFGLEHGQLEEQLEQRSREICRRLLADHLVLRAQREERIGEVADASGVARVSVEAGHHRILATIFGHVEVFRLAYRRTGYENLHPADGALNLPEERHSHGLRRWAAVEASRGSFDAAVDAIGRATGQQVGKRQVERLARQAATDVDAFYSERSGPDTDPGDVLVLSVDGKGIVMRPDSLRPATKRAAETSATKLATRLSGGEKRGRKRMAELGTVYDITPAPRSPDDILAGKTRSQTPKRPTATNKWLVASVVDDAAEVISQVFDEAARRDPAHSRT